MELKVLEPNRHDRGGSMLDRLRHASSYVYDQV